VPRPYVRVILDVWEREKADELTVAYPGWFVVWGTYWRCWSAFALFSPGPFVLHEVYTDALEARMRAAELAVRTRRGW
jgi:hypothetical protein